MRRPGLLLILLLAVSCADKAPAPGILYDFESEDELDRIIWQCRTNFALVPDHATSGTLALRCDFGGIRFPGIAFNDFPTDLSGIRSISMDLFNADEHAVNLVIRVDDAESGEAHDNRYNGSFDLQPGENHLTVAMETIRLGPKRRTLDLSRVERFLIFLYHSPGPVTIYIDRIELN